MSLENNNSSILNNLNNAQLDAVNRLTGSTLVIAGAGSGKTAVLTRRVANLIKHGIPAGSILCLTFTNKAAKEMNARVTKMCIEEGLKVPPLRVWELDYTKSPLLCTFHALGVRLLKEFYNYANLEAEFTVIDSDDRNKIIKELIKENSLDPKKVSHNFIGYFISQCKQELVLPEGSASRFSEYPDFAHRIYNQYQKKLKNNNAVDFDDLIFKTYFLLKDNPSIAAMLEQRWKHVMVDEYQDTNEAQFKVIEMISSPTKVNADPGTSIFVVGDDAKSIYGFRGSKVELILQFEDTYHGAKRIILNQNYRSTQPILNLAEKVISLNPNQFKKHLFTDKEDNIKVNYYQSRSEYDEANYIVKKLTALYQKKEDKEFFNSNGNSSNKKENSDANLQVIGGDQSANVASLSKAPKKPFNSISALFDNIYESLDTKVNSSYGGYSAYGNDRFEHDRTFYSWKNIKKLDEVAILYRTHGQSRVIEEMLIKSNIPYRLVSGTKFLERKEIKDVLSILKFINNGADKMSLSRFLPLVLDGVGAKTTEKIINYLDDSSLALAPKYQTIIMELMVKMQTAIAGTDSLIDFTKEILARVGYFSYLKRANPLSEDFEARIENIGELYSLMLQFEEIVLEENQGEETIDPDSIKYSPVKVKLQNFLNHAMLMTSQDNEEDANTPKVNLMTLHQSKGMEYETVFLVGIDDGILPHSRSLIDNKELEEEVRLAYVGITRAKNNLFLTSANSRTTFGKVEFYSVSRLFKPFLGSDIKHDK